MLVCPHGRANRAASAALRLIRKNDPSKPSQRDALQALLAFSALHDQVRRRKALAARNHGFDAAPPAAEFDQQELFVLDEVLQLVAERAVAITGADGLAIALAENNEIVLRAAAGTIRPDVGARIDRDSAFSGACFRTAQIVMCDDTETDPRVNLEACRKLGARSMVAVPLCGRRRVIGLLEAFSEWPFAFNESDIRNLSLLAELVLGALKPEDEDRFAESAQAAGTQAGTSASRTNQADYRRADQNRERGAGRCCQDRANPGRSRSRCSRACICCSCNCGCTCSRCPGSRCTRERFKGFRFKGCRFEDHCGEGESGSRTCDPQQVLDC